MSAGRKTVTDNKDWGTPHKYVEAVREFFGGEIDLDPCSNTWSIVKAKLEYKLPHNDGLKESWNYRRIYVNPPYGLDRKTGSGIKQWLCRCAHAHKTYGSEILALVPVATNTGHWKKFVFGQARSICFLSDTRLKFLESGKDGGKGAPMSCAMIYWGSNHARFTNTFQKFGAVLSLHELMDGNGKLQKNGQDDRLALLSET